MNEHLPDAWTHRPRHKLFLLGAIAFLLIGVAMMKSDNAVALAEAVPTNSVEPTISGTPVVGSTLSATQGSWKNTPTSFSYQWVRCPANGGAPDGSNCAAIAGATTLAYIPGGGDVGSRLRIRVTATNASGSATAASNATALVASSSKPANTSQPTITGSAVHGQTLTGTAGTWTGTTPITFSYQWVRCPSNGGAPDGSNCATISGATAAVHALQSGDVGFRMRFRVTASNSAGSQTAASNATAAVTASTTVSAPVNIQEPSISGTARQGSTLVAGMGSWSGTQPISYSIQWRRCGADGGRPDASNCTAITNGATYLLQPADVNGRIRVRVTATNTHGSSSAASNATSIIQSSAPPPGATVSISSVSLPQRLVIDKIQFLPNPVRTRQTTITLRVHISNTNGNAVEGALVFARSVPILTTTPPEQATGSDGWATLTFQPRPDFPLGNRSVQFFVRARKAGENILAGVSTRRLIQIRTAR